MHSPVAMQCGAMGRAAVGAMCGGREQVTTSADADVGCVGGNLGAAAAENERAPRLGPRLGSLPPSPLIRAAGRAMR